MTGKDVKNIKRIGLRMPEKNAERLEDLAERYGMTVNSLVGYIVGQWLDNNYDLKDIVREKQMEIMNQSAEKAIQHLMSHPEKLQEYEALFRVMGVPVSE
jgi:predicted DNA-binding protein